MLNSMPLLQPGLKFECGRVLPLTVDGLDTRKIPHPSPLVIILTYFVYKSVLGRPKYVAAAT
jgi:hypothetical protein